MASRLELNGISKRYPGVIANEGVSLRIAPGEIHAVLGENGAGKSTLMKIVYGAISPDSGKIVYDGREISRYTPAMARHLGIEMVYQHFALFQSVTVVENVLLSSGGGCDLQGLARRIAELSDRYGMPIDPWRHVYELSVGERQRVELIRCLLQDPRLLILDEPTSVLTPQAVLKLFDTLKVLAAQGCSILYISHKLDEVRALCDSATILRNGRVSGTISPKDCSTSALARMMVGEDLPRVSAPAPVVGAKPMLRVRGLSAPPQTAHGTALENISLDVRGGEIVGIAGVSGNGQSELVALLSGEATHPDNAVIEIDGVPMGRRGAAERRARGLAYVPEDRLGRGCVAAHSLWMNSILTAAARGLVARGFLRRRACRAFAQRIIDSFKVKANSADDAAQSLSGGNLQKFIVGREMALAPRVLLAVQPTWGVDVGAAAFIRQSLIDLSRSGTAVLLVSEELDELFEVCDRMMVMADGRLSPAMPTASCNREQIGLLMTHREAGGAGVGRHGALSPAGPASRQGGDNHQENQIATAA